jgi:hypothetical protein
MASRGGLLLQLAVKGRWNIDRGPNRLLFHDASVPYWPYRGMALTQVPLSVVVSFSSWMILAYGIGSTLTACWTNRKNSFPRLWERRRLNRKVNSPK